MKRLFMCAMMSLPLLAVTAGAALADGSVFDPVDGYSYIQTPMVVTSNSKTTATGAVNESVPRENINFQNAILQLDNAQVERRTNLMDLKTQFAEIDSKYVQVKTQRSGLKKQISKLEKDIKEIDKTKERIRKQIAP